MCRNQPTARRLRRLPTARLLGHQVRVADRVAARLLGLALLDRDRAGPGLLIPGCSSVHTFGMRFPIDVYFLDCGGRVLARRARVPAGRLVRCPGAAAVLEIPAAWGGREGGGEKRRSRSLPTACSPRAKR